MESFRSEKLANRARSLPRRTAVILLARARQANYKIRSLGVIRGQHTRFFETYIIYQSSVSLLPRG